MTPKMDLKWSPKGALKCGCIVLFAIPKRTHKTALIFSPFWTPPDPKMDANGSQSDSKTSQVRPTSEAKKEDITTYNRQARLQLLGFPKRFAETNPCAQAYVLLDFALRTLGDFAKKPLLRISKTVLQLSKYLDILEEEHKARARNTTEPRQDTAKASPKREPPEKKWGGGTPPKGGFQLNKPKMTL